MTLTSSFFVRGVAALALSACGALGCSSATSSASRPALAAPPPKDDGKPAEGGKGGSGHAAALEQLKISAADGRVDKQGSIKVPLPDAASWMRVKFWGVPSLVGFRYGKDHHALVAAFVTHVDDNALPGACAASFESWAKPWLTAFEVEVRHDTPVAAMWNRQVIDQAESNAATADENANGRPPRAGRSFHRVMELKDCDR